MELITNTCVTNITQVTSKSKLFLEDEQYFWKDLYSTQQMSPYRYIEINIPGQIIRK